MKSRMGGNMIPMFEPWLGEEELNQIKEVIESKWIAEGPKVREFEEKVAFLCEAKHAVAVSNGTIALYIGLKALGIGEGDEVVVPDFTFIASANAVKLTGATPVFVDVDEKTFNIDPEAAEKATTERTKAIMPVHLYGQAADMDEVMRIAEEHGLYVIEDAAEAIGVKFKGKPVGGFGNANCLSFYADKTITTGEGGMLLTSEDELAEWCRLFKNQGRFGGGAYIHPHLGYNFRLSDLQGAIGLAQLSKLSTIIERKRSNERLYRELLADTEGVGFPYIDPRSDYVPWRINILVEDPEALHDFLEKEEIGTRRFFYPIHKQPCYNLEGSFPNAERAYKRGLSLPSSPLLSEGQIHLVCQNIEQFMGKR